jgi:hypothetical protein
MAWPPTPKSAALWAALAAAIGVDRITHPRDDTHRSRVRVEVLDDARCQFRIGRVFRVAENNPGGVQLDADEEPTAASLTRMIVEGAR